MASEDGASKVGVDSSEEEDTIEDYSEDEGGDKGRRGVYVDEKARREARVSLLPQFKRAQEDAKKKGKGEAKEKVRDEPGTFEVKLTRAQSPTGILLQWLGWSRTHSDRSRYIFFLYDCATGELMGSLRQWLSRTRRKWCGRKGHGRRNIPQRR
jgi:hypothetical protein